MKTRWKKQNAKQKSEPFAAPQLRSVGARKATDERRGVCPEATNVPLGHPPHKPCSKVAKQSHKDHKAQVPEASSFTKPKSWGMSSTIWSCPCDQNIFFLL